MTVIAERSGKLLLLWWARRGFEVAFDLLNGKAKTGCQSVIIFVTDGKDTDGEEVRCGPGLSHMILCIRLEL